MFFSSRRFQLESQRPRRYIELGFKSTCGLKIGFAEVFHEDPKPVRDLLPQLSSELTHPFLTSTNTTTLHDVPILFGMLRQNIASKTRYCEKNGEGTGSPSLEVKNGGASTLKTNSSWFCKRTFSRRTMKIYENNSVSA